jgi:hypothetical protein
MIDRSQQHYEDQDHASQFQRYKATKKMRTTKQTNILQVSTYFSQQPLYHSRHPAPGICRYTPFSSYHTRTHPPSSPYDCSFTQLMHTQTAPPPTGSSSPSAAVVVHSSGDIAPAGPQSPCARQGWGSRSRHGHSTCTCLLRCAPCWHLHLFRRARSRTHSRTLAHRDPAPSSYAWHYQARASVTRDA